MTKLHLLDLFSGIGGFSLGLEASGYFETVAFCEINPKPHRVLRAHWPEVPIYDDINTLTAERLRADGIVRIDAICGGFPCQDISHAKTNGAEGLDGSRSGLWFEYARLIRTLRPKVVFVENVAGLLTRGLDRVLGTLAAIGYDAEWHCIPASYVGAGHRRDRIWLVAYPSGSRLSRLEQDHSLSIATEAARAIPGHDFARLGGVLAGDSSRLRSGDGVSLSVERAALHAYGNAVVPAIPEILGRVFGPAVIPHRASA